MSDPEPPLDEETHRLVEAVKRKILGNTDYIVMTSSAHVGARHRQRNERYMNVAVCEVEKGVRPKMISERAKGMVRIVKHWGACKVSTTGLTSEYSRALAAAEPLAARLK